MKVAEVCNFPKFLNNLNEGGAKVCNYPKKLKKLNISESGEQQPRIALDSEIFIFFYVFGTVAAFRIICIEIIEKFATASQFRNI